MRRYLPLALLLTTVAALFAFGLENTRFAGAVISACGAGGLRATLPMLATLLVKMHQGLYEF